MVVVASYYDDQKMPALQALTESVQEEMPALQALTESVHQEITDDNDALIVHGNSATKSDQSPHESSAPVASDFVVEPPAEESKIGDDKQVAAAAE